jgi:acetate kinase
MSDVLALNCGSSSLKYALFQGEEAALRGAMKIGAGGAADHRAAVHAVFDELDRRRFARPEAVGHRLVHGGPDHLQPERVTPGLMASLAQAVPFAPLHLPAELRAIEAVGERFGELPQVVCFDTAFHRTLPEAAQRLPLPAALHDSGVKRYGFHGLSYEYVVDTLGAASLGRAVLAHLGSGASMAAVRDGRSIDTTMGFSPTGGLVMGTRSGDLDPGVLVYLLQQRGFDADRLDRLVNHEAGLLALSGTTADMQRLVAERATHARAALAVSVFCYQARKWVGAFAAALGGIDTLVFTGGIGEASPEVRREICGGLGHLGVALEDAKNEANEAIVSPQGSACRVRVLRTDEERQIAKHTRTVVRLDARS